MDALSDCRDDDRVDEIAVLEQIAAGLGRDRDAAHAQLERLEAAEQARICRDRCRA